MPVWGQAQSALGDDESADRAGNNLVAIIGTRRRARLKTAVSNAMFQSREYDELKLHLAEPGWTEGFTGRGPHGTAHRPERAARGRGPLRRAAGHARTLPEPRDPARRPHRRPQRWPSTAHPHGQRRL